MREPLWLSLGEVLAFHERLLAEFGGSAGVRDEGLLESALGRPKNLFAYVKPSMFELAASYAFGIVKNHPFIDGNKRAGHAAMETLLILNGFEISASVDEQEATILALASGATSRADFTAWLIQHVVPTSG